MGIIAVIIITSLVGLLSPHRVDASSLIQQLDKSTEEYLDSRGVPRVSAAYFQTLNWNGDYGNPQLTVRLTGTISKMTFHIAPLNNVWGNYYRFALIERVGDFQGAPNIPRMTDWIPFITEDDYTFSFPPFTFDPDNAYELRVEFGGFNKIFGSVDPSSYPFGNSYISTYTIKDLYFVTDASLTTSMIKPTASGRITDLFRPADNPKHNGIDIDSDIVGTPVLSAAAGTIMNVSTSSESDCGQWIWIFNGDITELDGTLVPKISTVYLHLNNINAQLKVGSKIEQGTQLGIVDSTGVITGGHLHFGVREGDIPSTITCKNRIGDTTTPLNPLDFVDYEIKPQSLSVNLRSNADLVVTDPDGLIVSKQRNDLANVARYLEVKRIPDLGEEEGLPDYDKVQIDQKKNGDYKIQVIPEPQASATSTFSLSATLATTTNILVRDIRIADIPTQSYILRSTDTGVQEIFPAQVSINSKTLNLSSRGVFTAFIDFQKGFGISISDIDSSTINANGAPVQKTMVSDKKLIAKFNIQDLFNNTSSTNVMTIKVSGKLINGMSFEGFDNVKVINKIDTLQLNDLTANIYVILSELLTFLRG